MFTTAKKMRIEAKEKRISLFFILLLCLCTHIQASVKRHEFFRIGLEMGLPNTRVTSLCCQSNGCMWIGTYGVGRLDNEKVNMYPSGTGKREIYGHSVSNIFEDRQQNVWICCDVGNPGEVARYQEYTDDFQHYPVQASCGISCMEGTFFFGKETVYRYKAENDQIVEAATLPEDFCAQQVFRYLGGKLLLLDNSQQTQCLFDPKTLKIGNLDFELPKNAVFFVDSQRQIWCGRSGQGLECYGINGTLLYQYTTENSDLSNNYLKLIDEDHGRIVAVTDDGVNIIDPKTNSFEVLRIDPNDKRGLPVNCISALFCDQNGQIWLGNANGGVHILRHTQLESYTRTNYGGETVQEFCELPGSPYIYFGTVGSGIFRYDPHEQIDFVGQEPHGTLEWIPETSGLNISSLCPLSDHEILMSCYDYGMAVFDTRTKKHRLFPLGNEILDGWHDYWGVGPFTLHVIGNNIYIMSSQYQFRYDKVQRETVPLTYSGSWEGGFPMYVDHAGERCCFTLPHGLYEVDAETDEIHRLVHFPDSVSVCNGTFDGEHFWLASNEGLLRVDAQPVDNQYKTYPMPSDEVKLRMLMCDSLDRVWIGTEHSLSFFNKKKEHFHQIRRTCGLNDNSYMNSAKYHAQNGDLYFGGMEGFVRVDEHLVMEEEADPTIRLMSMQIDGEYVPDPQNAKISSNTFVIVFNTFTSEAHPHREKHWRFLVEGERDLKKVIVQKSPTLVLNHLRPDRYTISASCSNKCEQFTDWTPIAHFRIMPKWYRTWWFMISFILFMSLCIYLILRQHYLRYKEMERSNFLININHELRTPLTLIQGPLRRALKGESVAEEMKAKLRKAYNQTEHMQLLLNTVITMEKLRDGYLKTEMKPVELNKWLRRIAEEYREEVEAHDMMLAIKTDSTIGKVSFDEDLCKILVSNMVLNALKHNKKGCHITLSSSWNEDKSMVRIAVRDHGSSVGVINSEKLFDKFHERTEDKAGYGIGLAFSHYVVKAHHGKMGAQDNANDEGACFWFALNANPSSYLAPELASWQTEDENVKEDSYERILLKSKTILLVDDDKDLRDYLCEELSEKCRLVLQAYNGRHALEVLEKNPVDIIISDIMMPEMDGIEFCHELKADQRYKDIPIMLLTARVDDRLMKEAQKIPVNAYLTKPFTMEAILRTLEGF